MASIGRVVGFLYLRVLNDMNEYWAACFSSHRVQTL